MGKKSKIYFSWSSGKDATLALYYLKKENNFSIKKLATTVNSQVGRVSMHGLPIQLLEQQAKAIGIPLEIINLTPNLTMKQYERVMQQILENYKKEGFDYCAFGDVFLEDLKRYREKQLASFGITPLFPLWKRNTRELLNEFTHLGFKAVIICINSSKLDESFLGRIINDSLLDELPKDVDPCGENGEFHTFCYDGPLFKNPVKFSRGKSVSRKYPSPENSESGVEFRFLDLIPR